MNNNYGGNIISKLFRFFLGDGILKICALFFNFLEDFVFLKNIDYLENM